LKTSSDEFATVTELMKIGWPMARIQGWLAKKDISITIRQLFNIRKKYIPDSELIPVHYKIESLLKGVDVQIDQMSESAKLILAQKERVMRAMDQEASLGVVLPHVKSEIRLLHEMLMSSYDREHGLVRKEGEPDVIALVKNVQNVMRFEAKPKKPISDERTA